MRLRRFSLLKRFANAEDGSISIEAVLWFIMMTGVIGLLIDATMVFQSYSLALRTLQDGNRNLSVGRFETEAETETYIQTELAGLSPNVTATATMNGRIVTTFVTLPVTDLGLVGFFNGLDSVKLNISGKHYLETPGT